MDDQKKKMSVWEIIASVVFIGLIAYSFFTSPTDPKNADRRMAFYDALAHSQTDTVALADLTSFPWDSVCFFSECRVAEAQKYVKTVPQSVRAYIAMKQQMASSDSDNQPPSDEGGGS